MTKKCQYKIGYFLSICTLINTAYDMSKFTHKTYWTVFNRLLNRKKVINIPPLLENGIFVTNVQTKASILNEFFVKQCSTITTGSTIPTFLPQCDEILQDLIIDREKVLQLIRSLNSNKAHGWDGISAHMIKLCDSSIVEPLCLIFEKCIETGKYPSIWKKANIVPVHKKDSRQNKENYRPISLLPILGKMFEKVIFDAMYKHFCDNGFLTPNQSGFRPGDSTINQLLAITHKIYCAFESVPSLETRSIFLDLSKAFDKVWHDGLLYKLESSGISGKLLALMRSFLVNRRQRVVLNGKCSNWETITSGVPQGSVLGPLLFLIYINDIVENVNCDIKLFADDTSLFQVVRGEARTALELNRDLERIRLWAWQWKMQFNAQKTEEVIFSTKKVKPQHPPLSLGSEEIVRKTEHKHLGMILDEKLDFESHIREAIIKARKGIGMIKFLAKYVSRTILDQIYKLYIRPHLDYGDIIYHKYDPHTTLDATKRLEQTQYSAALAITGAWRGTSRQRLYDELGWEDLYHRRWFRRLCHFYNLRKNRQPEYLFDEIPATREISYSLRNVNEYDAAVCRTNRFSNTYFHNVLLEWNALAKDIRESNTLGEFKSKLLKKIRPVKKPLYEICDTRGVRCLTKLRVRFSPLGEHKFRHNFESLSPICTCNTGIEDNEHFLLHCPLYDQMRNDLFDQLSEIPGLELDNLNSEALCELLLFGNPRFNNIANKLILEATISFILSTGRLE